MRFIWCMNSQLGGIRACVICAFLEYRISTIVPMTFSTIKQHALTPAATGNDLGIDDSALDIDYGYLSQTKSNDFNS